MRDKSSFAARLGLAPIKLRLSTPHTLTWLPISSNGPCRLASGAYSSRPAGRPLSRPPPFKEQGVPLRPRDAKLSGFAHDGSCRSSHLSPCLHFKNFASSTPSAACSLLHLLLHTPSAQKSVAMVVCRWRVCVPTTLDCRDGVNLQALAKRSRMRGGSGRFAEARCSSCDVRAWLGTRSTCGASPFRLVAQLALPTVRVPAAASKPARKEAHCWITTVLTSLSRKGWHGPPTSPPVLVPQSRWSDAASQASGRKWLPHRSKSPQPSCRTATCTDAHLGAGLSQVLSGPRHDDLAVVPESRARLRSVPAQRPSRFCP